MSIVARFWTFTAAIFALYLFLVWKAAGNPGYLPGTFLVPIIWGLSTRRFHCPYCENPIMKHRTTANRTGYAWRLPTSRFCPNCGIRL